MGSCTPSWTPYGYVGDRKQRIKIRMYLWVHFRNYISTCYILKLASISCKNMCPYPRNFKNICIAIILWEKMCFCFVIGYFVLQLWQRTASSQSQQFLIKDERIYFVRISLYCCHNDATTGKRGTTNGQTLNYQTSRRAEKSISECFEQQLRCLRSIGWVFRGIRL